MSMNKDETIKARALDKIEQCVNKNFITNTVFLDTHQQSLLRELIAKKKFGCEISFRGGYEDAERVAMLCVPEYLDPEMADIFRLIRVKKRSKEKPLSHGDFLGSLLGLGIKREMTGDIIVRDDGADIIVMEEIAEFISDNYIKVGRIDISTEVLPLDELLIPEKEKTLFYGTVASLRLDNTVSSGFKISRSKAAQAIRSGSVCVNHMEICQPDFRVEEGDLINVRKKGRIRLNQVGGRTGKDRIGVTFEK